MTACYTYDVENRLTSATGPANVTLGYDPVGRLAESAVAGMGATEFLYDGSDLVAEFDPGSGNLIRRYVHGPGVDEPLVWYEGAGTSDRRYVHTDERGSVIALSNASGSALATYAYGPYGEAEGSSFSRFGFTGQTVIEGTEIMHFKARAYSPALGRFLQPDPIGFAGGDTNLYSYAAGDPVNFTDPSGLIFGKIFKGLKKAAKFVVKGAKKVVKAANKVSKFAGPATILINPEAALVNRIIAAAALARTGSGLIGGESTGAEGGDAGKDDNGSLFTRVGNFFSNVVDTASDHHDDFREKHCFVGKIEGVFGLVGEFSARGVGPGGVPVGVSLSGDAASIRLRGKIGEGFSAVATQGVAAGIFVPPIFSDSFSFQREGRAGVNVPRSERLPNQPFEADVNTFVGVEVGAALIFGASGRLGATTNCN